MLASRLQSTGARNFASKLLFLSLLPTLLFVGHWTLRIDIPGTNYYIGPAVTQASNTHHHHDASPGEERAHDHGQHCHANSATCADAAAVPTAPVANLAEGLAALGAESPWRQIPTETRGLTGWTSVPTSPPPRSSQSV